MDYPGMIVSYRTIAEPNEYQVREKASDFIAYAFPISDEIHIKNYLDQLRKDHIKATHVCYAYRLGVDKNQFRANDDGEPSGTAGKPILGQIDAAGLTHVLVAVVRYYGGTKLGASGLIQAYKEAAFGVLSQCKPIEIQIVEVYTISFDTIHYNRILPLLKKNNIRIMQQQFDSECLLIIEVALINKDAFFKACNELYDVHLKISPANENIM